MPSAFIQPNSFTFIMSAIVTGGSKSFSPGTSIMLIALAPGSPGEQGVSRSFTHFEGSFGEGPCATRDTHYFRKKNPLKFIALTRGIKNDILVKQGDIFVIDNEFSLTCLKKDTKISFGKERKKRK